MNPHEYLILLWHETDSKLPTHQAGRRESSLLHEAGFQGDGHAVHLAINLVIAVHQPDGFGLGSAFEHLIAAAEFQI